MLNITFEVSLSSVSLAQFIFNNAFFNLPFTCSTNLHLSPPEGHTRELTAGESLSTGFTQSIVDSGRIRAFEKLAENTNIAQHSREGYRYRKWLKWNKKTVEAVKLVCRTCVCMSSKAEFISEIKERRRPNLSVKTYVRWPTDQRLHGIRKQTEAAMFVCFFFLW